MVHNGVEYGMMAAIAEGLSIIKHADAGKVNRTVDAETTPLRDPWAYQYTIDVGEVAEVWRRGSVVARGWSTSPPTRWHAHRSSTTSPVGYRTPGRAAGRCWPPSTRASPRRVITTSLFERFESRELGEFTDKILSAMRSEFGGHDEKTVRPSIVTAPATTPADVLVIFGITGDLARKMTFRSLYRLERRKLLDCPIVGVALDDWSEATLRDHARSAIEASGETIDEDVFARFAQRLSMVSGDFADAKTYDRVAKAIEGKHTPVFYLEIPPSLFGRVVEGLAHANLTSRARVVVEKPFGHDLASARALNAQLRSVLEEWQIFRIDHFLGKEPAMDIMFLRFANSIFEPLWNRDRIQCVQITMAENFGVEDRGSFYDPVGALRDVVQNHLLQLIGLFAAEPPSVADADGLRDKRAEVFRAIPVDRSRALCARAVRRLSLHQRGASPIRRPRRSPRCGWRSTTGAGRAFRSSCGPARHFRCGPPRSGSSSSVRPSWRSPSLTHDAERTRAAHRSQAGHRSDHSGQGARRQPHPHRRPVADLRRGARRGARTLRAAAQRRDARRLQRSSPARTVSRRPGASCSR